MRQIVGPRSKVELSGFEPDSSQRRQLRSTCVVPVLSSGELGREHPCARPGFPLGISRSVGAGNPCCRHPNLGFEGTGERRRSPGSVPVSHRSGGDEGVAVGEGLDLSEIGVRHERIVVVRDYLSAPTLAVVESHSLARCSVVSSGCRNLSAPRIAILEIQLHVCKISRYNTPRAPRSAGLILGFTTIQAAMDRAGPRGSRLGVSKTTSGPASATSRDRRAYAAGRP